MKKNNNEVSQIGLKRAAKNKARIKRSTELKEFNDLAFRVKAMKAYFDSINNEVNNDTNHTPIEKETNE
jgi:hypothetical protein